MAWPFHALGFPNQRGRFTLKKITLSHAETIRFLLSYHARVSTGMGPEGFQRASGKPFGRLRRGEILYVCKRTMHDLQNDKAEYFANKRNGRGSIKAWNRGHFYASYQLFSKKGVPSSRTSTSMSEKCRGTGLVIRYFRISSMRTLSWKVTREKLTPCLWARPVRPMRWR